MNKLIYSKINKKALKTYLLFTIPFLLLFLYFYGLGRSRYTVTSNIIIRKTSDNNQTGFDISSFLGAGNTSSKEDSLYMQTYLVSPQVLEIAEKKLNFTQKYKKKLPDILAGIKRNNSKTELYRYFRKQIFINFIERSGILKITTVAYDPQTAYDLNGFLINQSEQFANELNQNVYKRQLDFVNEQVKIQSNKVKKASQELLDFQRKNAIINPLSEGVANSRFINALESELIKLKVELASLNRIFVNNNEPEIVDLTNQILELSQQINKERQALVSPDGKNLNYKILEISELENKLKFSLDLYKASLTTAEATRLDSFQKKRFMEIISMPFLPDKESNNWRNKGFFSTSALILLIFGIFNFFKVIANGRRQ